MVAETAVSAHKKPLRPTESRVGPQKAALAHRKPRRPTKYFLAHVHSSRYHQCATIRKLTRDRMDQGQDQESSLDDSKHDCYASV